MKPVTLIGQTLRPRCPRCGEGKLFKDMLSVVDSCSECTLVLKHHDAADAPTFFALCIVGLLVTVGAAIVEVKFEPAMWVHAALWIPLTFIGSILCLRMFKAIFITMEHRMALLKQEDPRG
ncbi:MAG: DUF983 domain-containing protein [Rickettsiales bacterium]